MPRPIAEYRYDLLLLVLSTLVGLGCHGEPTPSPGGNRVHPALVIGIDGAEWRAVREMWDQGRLPHLRALAERGSTAELRTAYGASPVIWTTIATGRTPADHGITGFVVPTDNGDVPVSSTLRTAPALWTIAARADRRVAALGWWASWPAEEINGIIVSDRALVTADRAVSPSTFVSRFDELRRRALAEEINFRGNPAAEERDQVMARVAEALAAEQLDLLMVYLRSLDIASHHYWKYYRPQAFGDVDPDQVARLGSIVPESYEAVDEAIGRIVSALPTATNVFVLSDHGFHAKRNEEVRVVMDLDLLLERIGFLERRDGVIDRALSRAVTHASPPAKNPKMIRFLNREDSQVADDLKRRLGQLTWESGVSAFEVRAPDATEREQGADLVIRVRGANASRSLVNGATVWNDIVREIVSISGTHGSRTHGIFLAAGPDIGSGAPLDGIGIHHIAATVLYSLDIPSGEDFAGPAWTELFTEAFRDAHPLRTIPSWGQASTGSATPSEVDQALVEELRTLGYVN